MKSVPAPLLAIYAADASQIAHCMQITRADGQVLRFTDHDRDLIVDGATYRTHPGFDGAALTSRAGLQVDNSEARSFLDDTTISETDLRAGLWDHAEVRIFAVAWADPSLGRLRMLRGWLGEFTIDGAGWKTELRSLANALNTSIGELVMPSCAAVLGDARCGMDLTEYTTTGEVTAVVSNRVFDTDVASATVRLTPTTTGNPPADYFTGGLLTWDTGANAGRRMEVRTSAADGRISLQLSMASPIVAGDTFTAETGCAKSIEVCKAKFGNVVRFRGAPHLPGIDRILRVGGQ